jgi:hypothetical protein
MPCPGQSRCHFALRPLFFDGVVVKVENARSAKPCDGLVPEQMDGGKLAEDEEINLVRLQEGRHAFLDNGAVIFLDDAGRVEIPLKFRATTPSVLHILPPGRPGRIKWSRQTCWQVVICLARIHWVLLEENGADFVAPR